MNLKEIYKPIQTQMEQIDLEMGKVATQNHGTLSEILQYITQTPGKRIRPAISLLSASFHPSDRKLSVLGASAIELVHIASLVHDDMVDNASKRRGMPTVNKLWGEDAALLLGDYLFATSASYAANAGNLRVMIKFAESIANLSKSALIESLDKYKLDQTYEDYKERIYNKTASLFCVASETGAILSGAPESIIQSLSIYGHNLGMAFQIVDDILDFDASEKEVGKPVGNDISQGIVTLPIIQLLKHKPESKEIIKSIYTNASNHQRLLELIYNSNAIKESFDIARQFCRNAEQSLLDLPKTAARESLNALISHTIERRK